ncbi:hypothetical protein RV15_GL003035 [Enterococcus silesiacus]|uniref:histidine kinase n=1 Tax=Enterococcus silesiacus TaxID=332949 RepID=A0AA91GC93_9ENTE|nr:hypothetical protein RV15_GL003035 [Enterococcus silesiacus]
MLSYQESNQILMNKIQNDYELLNDNINRIFETVSKSQGVQDYFKQDQSEEIQAIIKLQKEMASTSWIFNDTPSNLILIGKNGRTFFQNEGVRSQSLDTFFKSDLMKEIDGNPALSQYFYQQNGLTISTAKQPGLLYIRKITDDIGIIGYALIFVPEQYFASIYEQVLAENIHTIYITDSENTVISSNQKSQLGTTLSNKIRKADNNYTNSLKLYSYNFTLYNLINEDTLIKNMNLIRPTITIVFFSIMIASVIAFIVIRRMTGPIYRLIDALPSVTQGEFSNSVAIEGTYETQELGKAYNLMLEDLQGYFDHLMTVEEEKRLTEIRSLQMQIQPHFIYNTLTAIKFLIWQGERDKASLAMDNFIQLLRHTLSNKDEVVPLKQELNGVEAYINILQLRYGERIQTNIFANEAAEELLVPKMIIQPIIENTYLHAFPEHQEGYIQVFATTVEDKLQIEIIDNGVGFDDSQPPNTQSTLKQHYSGLGLRNIHERIQLLYGEKYGLKIQTAPGEGTSIKLLMPINHPKKTT